MKLPCVSEDSLGRKAPEKRIERVCINRQTLLCQFIRKTVSVFRLVEEAHDGKHDRAAPHLHPVRDFRRLPSHGNPLIYDKYTPQYTGIPTECRVSHCIALFIIVEALILTTVSYKNNTIPDNYQIIFKGESGEVVYTTYYYEKKKGKKYTYKYINTISSYQGYDSESWQEKIIKKGKIKEKNKIIEIAEKNNATSYVKYKKEEKIYTLEEFKNILK